MALNTIYMFMTIQLGSPSTQHLHLGISNSVSSKRNPHTSFTPPRLPHHSCSHHFFNCWDKKPWRHSWSLSFSHALHLFNLSVNPIGSIFESFRIQLPLVISTVTILAPLDCARCFHLCLQTVSLNMAASVILWQYVSDFVTFILKTLPNES